MIFKYPYTDMYALNLDWIIQAIKEMQETIAPLDRVVNSVNGLTGDVEITKALLTQILGNLVETFNGRTGDVELTAEDVNNTLIDITWTSDPGDTISDLTQAELDEMYLSGKRVLIFVNNLGVADQVYFLQYYEGHAQPQEYSPTAALAGVASFNGQTGNVTVTGDDLETSGTDTRTIAESLEDLEETKVPVTRTVNNQPLSTNISINAANVPSQAITGATDVEMALGNLNNSKVPNSRQVNGKSLLNDITLNDEDIPSQVISGETTVEGVLTDLDSRVSSQSQQIGNVALPTTASTLTGAIAENTENIGDLTQLATTDKDSLVEAVNEIVADNTTIRSIYIDIGSYLLGGNPPVIRKINRLCIIQFFALQNLTDGSDTVIGTIPEGYRPAYYVQANITDPSNHVINFTIYSDGRIVAHPYGVTATNLRASIAYFA